MSDTVWLSPREQVDWQAFIQMQELLRSRLEQGLVPVAPWAAERLRDTPTEHPGSEPECRMGADRLPCRPPRVG